VNHVQPDSLGEFRNVLFAVLKRRLPSADAEDVAQATLTEALTSQTFPQEEEAQKRWLWGVARHKVADHYRRTAREVPHESEVSEPAAGPAENDLLTWAEKMLPPGQDARQTLEWLLREGDGEDLASIAESEKIPAPRVRKRVSRMREHFRAHWKKEAALLAAIGIVLAWMIYRQFERTPQVVPNIIAEKPYVAPPWMKERTDALDRCREQKWQECVDGLDRAAQMDPAGDASEEVQNARKAASEALKPAPVLPPPAPSASAPPPTPPTNHKFDLSEDSISQPAPPQKPTVTGITGMGDMGSGSAVTPSRSKKK